MVGSASAAQTILIVEDNTDLRRLYRDALSLAGFKTCEAANGYEALQCLEHQKIDLVVLDVVLPLYSGHVVRAELAAQAPGIPIIVVTGTDDPVPNVSAVMRKPVSPDQLVHAVRRHLRQRDV